MQISMLAIILSSVALTSCIHPDVGLRKARLLDPMMDPARPVDFSDIAQGSPQANFERGLTNNGGRTGGSCPTCK